MAMVGPDYQFLWVDVGVNGTCSDAQIFNGCSLKQAIERERLGVPPAEPLSHDDMPYYIVGDDVFTLKPWLMKPYSMKSLEYDKRIFNYRLSRARRIVENAFGIMANRWQCLFTMMRQDPATMVDIVLSSCVLHNILRKECPSIHNNLVDVEDAEHNIIPGQWRQGQQLEDDMFRPQARENPNVTKEAQAQRDYLKAYFMSGIGKVSWQDKMVQS